MHDCRAPFYLLLSKNATISNSVHLYGIALINFNQGAAVTDSTSHEQPEPRRYLGLFIVPICLIKKSCGKHLTLKIVTSHSGINYSDILQAPCNR